MNILLAAARKAAVILFLAGALPAASVGAQAASVDLRLVLAVDCSYSVDAREFRLQMQGIASAFRSEELAQAIAQGDHRRIDVLLMQWSSESSQIVAVPWTPIASRADALAFAERVAATPRLTAEGGTSLSAALLFAAGLLEQSEGALRRVVDISADGRNNTGQEMGLVRNILVGRGITINGLAIENEVANLQGYFARHVVGGTDFFVVTAKNYDAYAEAIQRKLIREIAGPPVS